jgi:hemerythrin superfamily protein
MSPNHEPVDHFANCHLGIFAQLALMSELPALLPPAAQARKIAQQSLAFFNKALYEHHSEEEKELFTAVHGSAHVGQERMQVQALIDQLTADHRALEKLWESLEQGLHKVAKGQDTSLDTAALHSLVERYRNHALLEEQQFLPLAERILGRNSNHMAALGLSLHMRHAPSFFGHI